MNFSRRQFLQLAAAAGLAPAPRILLRAAESAAAREGDGVLVVLQLSGGNDGLNTVVPVDDDIYHRSRPTPKTPTLMARPSVKARSGSWQPAQARVPSAERIGSKKSFRPRATFSGVMGLSSGTGM